MINNHVGSRNRLITDCRFIGSVDPGKFERVLFTGREIESMVWGISGVPTSWRISSVRETHAQSGAFRQGAKVTILRSYLIFVTS